jgi:hypothetical protein
MNQTTKINGREFKVTERECLLGSAINRVNPAIIAMVVLTGVRGAAKMAYQLTDGSFDIISSL